MFISLVIVLRFQSSTFFQTNDVTAPVLIWTCAPCFYRQSHFPIRCSRSLPIMKIPPGYTDHEMDFQRNVGHASTQESEMRVKRQMVRVRRELTRYRTRLLASHQGKPGSIPDGVTPGFSHLRIVPDTASVQRVFSGISRFPAPSFLHTRGVGGEGWKLVKPRGWKECERVSYPTPWGVAHTSSCRGSRIISLTLRRPTPFAVGPTAAVPEGVGTMPLGPVRLVRRLRLLAKKPRRATKTIDVFRLPHQPPRRQHSSGLDWHLYGLHELFLGGRGRPLEYPSIPYSPLSEFTRLARTRKLTRATFPRGFKRRPAPNAFSALQSCIRAYDVICSLRSPKCRTRVRDSHRFMECFKPTPGSIQTVATALGYTLLSTVSWHVMKFTGSSTKSRPTAEAQTKSKMTSSRSPNCCQSISRSTQHIQRNTARQLENVYPNSRKRFGNKVNVLNSQKSSVANLMRETRRLNDSVVETTEVENALVPRTPAAHWPAIWRLYTTTRRNTVRQSAPGNLLANRQLSHAVQAGETGDPRGNPPTNGIVRHDSHKRKSGVTRPGIEPGSSWWEASRLTAQPRVTWGGAWRRGDQVRQYTHPAPLA
ncbi:hypothetical protein PR048_031190 [Dryococelus australis]|uniref:Uncharacterized protein n=1 Tax=Dryococelus australis TaxID=614101 RepID=A0ABQ9G8M5_9NEOP|nr:hypothetical protein PR048_031190 [Dryococelus australis]